MLGLIVLGAVLVVTIVFSVAAYLIDRGEARLEEGATTSVEPFIRREEQVRHAK